jgi:hypothetical protein
MHQHRVAGASAAPAFYTGANRLDRAYSSEALGTAAQVMARPRRAGAGPDSSQSAAAIPLGCSHAPKTHARGIRRVETTGTETGDHPHSALLPVPLRPRRRHRAVRTSYPKRSGRASVPHRDETHRGKSSRPTTGIIHSRVHQRRIVSKIDNCCTNGIQAHGNYLDPLRYADRSIGATTNPACGHAHSGGTPGFLHPHAGAP